MSLELKQLSPMDGLDIYEMLQKLPPKENGFTNTASGLSLEEYPEWLRKEDERSVQVGIVDELPAITTYWLFENGKPVGYGKIRHELTDKLRFAGGNVGYTIINEARNRGLGKKILAMLLEKAREMGLEKVLITVQNHNTPSMSVILANGGKLDHVTDLRHYYWIEL